MNRLLLFKKPMSYIGGQVKWNNRSVIGNKLKRVPSFEPQELVSDWDFTAADLSAWTIQEIGSATIAKSSDTVIFTGAADGVCNISQAIAITGGKTYTVIIDVTAIAGTLNIDLGDIGSPAEGVITTSGIWSEDIVADSADNVIRVTTIFGETTTATINSISVMETA